MRQNTKPVRKRTKKAEKQKPAREKVEVDGGRGGEGGRQGGKVEARERALLDFQDARRQTQKTRRESGRAALRMHKQIDQD